MNKKITFKGIKDIFKTAFKGFSDDKVTKLSGSLAYSTVFSLGPLLIVIISLCSIFLGRAAVEGKIYAELSSFVGPDTASQLQHIIQNAAINGKSHIAIIVGGITLLIGSTAIFGEIQDSINMIWGLKSKPRTGWRKILINRFLSFSVIIGLGFLLLVSLGISSLIDLFSRRLEMHFHNITLVFFYVANVMITFIVTIIIFTVIFKVLPDAHIKWKDVLPGAVATALLFMAGKFGISFYISKSNIGSTYGTTGSLVVLLLWIYYSSIILYFGAELTKGYTIEYGSNIHPNDYTVTTKVVEVDKPGQANN